MWKPLIDKGKKITYYNIREIFVLTEKIITQEITYPLFIIIENTFLYKIEEKKTLKQHIFFLLGGIEVDLRVKQLKLKL